jgi:hypothetical protein
MGKKLSAKTRLASGRQLWRLNQMEDPHAQ